ncbi:MAG: hypothetical protein H0W22_00085 [Chloroflexi bacterium]|nr:hypothetical protein [Chloroflexota bacterium]
MTDRSMRPTGGLDDGRLEAALRDLVGAIDWPTAAPAGSPDIAVRIRVRLMERPARTGLFGWPVVPWRRALVLALTALLALAAIAGAVGLGLPGLQLILGQPSSSPPPSVEPSRTAPSGPLGSTLRLGEPVGLDEVEALTGNPPRLPSDPAIGPPDSVYLDPSRGNQAAFIWASGRALPATREPGIGLILMRFDGTVDDGFRQKILGDDVTAQPVSVDGGRGFWISGPAHFFFYVGADGTIIDDDRRWVDDALVWSDGATTYRLETSLGRDAAIALAESLE